MQELGCQGTKWEEMKEQEGGPSGDHLHGSEAVNMDRVDGCLHISWVGTDRTHA